MVHAATGTILSLAQGWGRQHDFCLLEHKGLGLRHRVAVCLADRGYQGLEKLLPGAVVLMPIKASKGRVLSLQAKAINRELGRRRMVVEHVIGALKRFRILSERYRNRQKRLGLRFNLIAALYNLEIRP